MNDRILDWAMKLQSIAQAGLTYGRDPYDLERYEQLRALSAEMLSARTDIPAGTIQGLFCNEVGYQTPKIDTRAAVFRDGKILLVREKNGTWSLPGGWCDVDQSVASNAVKEVREEAGLEVVAERLIAVQDWRRHNVTNYAYGVIKIFVLCRALGGAFEANLETDAAVYFGRDALPSPLAVEKVTAEQLLMCFDANESPAWRAVLE
ncbi:MAG TPA: ADP-ribose pyrophosphatase [Clostridiales bacterium]|nr:ADP-ribose pyrophosphatase [Clostridiales bacterium]